jgi:hypothetical protein
VRLTQLFQMKAHTWDVSDTEGPALLKHLGRDDTQRVHNGAQFLALCSYYKKMGGEAAEIVREKAEAAEFERLAAERRKSIADKEARQAAKRAARAVAEE